jgi:hypothetical protein
MHLAGWYGGGYFFNVTAITATIKEANEIISISPSIIEITSDTPFLKRSDRCPLYQIAVHLLLYLYLPVIYSQI